jgi:hypothetical protein
MLADSERFPIVVSFPRFDKPPEKERTPATFSTGLSQRLLDTDIMFWVVLGIGVLIAFMLIGGRVSNKTRPATNPMPAIVNSTAETKAEVAEPTPPTPIPNYREPKIVSTDPKIALPDSGAQVVTRHEEEVVTIPPSAYQTLQNSLESTPLTADRGQRASEERRRDGAADTSGRAHFTGTILKIDAQPSNDSP